MIDYSHFTPLPAFAGGLMIGAAAGLLALGAGRVAGISGIVGGSLFGPQRGWRLAFLAGLLAAPLLAGLTPPRLEGGWGTTLLAGLLVGLGTRYANGCTSGHGVCGLSRGSRRSLAATLVFMAAGFATVFVRRHWLGA